MLVAPIAVTAVLALGTGSADAETVSGMPAGLNSAPSSARPTVAAPLPQVLPSSVDPAGSSVKVPAPVSSPAPVASPIKTPSSSPMAPSAPVGAASTKVGAPVRTQPGITAVQVSGQKASTAKGIYHGAAGTAAPIVSQLPPDQSNPGSTLTPARNALQRLPDAPKVLDSDTRTLQRSASVLPKVATTSGVGALLGPVTAIVGPALQKTKPLLGVVQTGVRPAGVLLGSAVKGLSPKGAVSIPLLPQALSLVPPHVFDNVAPPMASGNMAPPETTGNMGGTFVIRAAALGGESAIQLGVPSAASAGSETRTHGDQDRLRSCPSRSHSRSSQ